MTTRSAESTELRVRTGYVTAAVSLPCPAPEVARLAGEVDRMLPGGWQLDPLTEHAPAEEPDVRIVVTATSGPPSVRVAEDGLVRVALGPEALASTTLAYVVYTVTERARQHRGMVTAYAAAAAGPDGRAVLLLGDKGAGKTSTLFALLAAGYWFLGDDLVVLADRGNHPDRLGVLPGRRYCAVRQVNDRFGYEAKTLVDLAASTRSTGSVAAAPSVAAVLRVSIHPATTAKVTGPAALSLTERLRLAENLARYISGIPTPLAVEPEVSAPVYPLDDPTCTAVRARLIDRIGAMGLRYLHAPTALAAVEMITGLMEELISA